jgi:hypothetical protein
MRNAYYAQALGCAASSATGGWWGSCWATWAEAARARGDYETAVPLYEEALMIAREIGKPQRGDLSPLEAGRGADGARGPRAEADLQQAILMSEATGERHALGFAHLFLAELWLDQASRRRRWRRAGGRWRR